jgi:hypothetical protein
LTDLSIVSYQSGAFIDNINGMTKLQTLSLYLYYSDRLPSLAGMTALKSVAMYAGYQGGSFSVPSNIFDGLTQITSLTISTGNAAAVELPDFTNNTGITTLSLSYTQMNDAKLASYNFTKLTKLSSIILSGNPQLTKLPTSLATISTLSTINVDSCALNLVDSFFDMRETRITSINVAYNGITTLPAAFCQMTTRTAIYGNITLYMAGNELTSLPSCFFNNPFNTLTLGDTAMTSFPTGLMNTYIRRLRWYSNNARMSLGAWDLSKWLETMTSFQLEDTQLEAPFPSGFATSLILGRFSVPGNHFYGTMPDNFFQGGTIYEFSVGGSALTGPFPSSVGEATELDYIEAYGNKFTSIPDSIQNLANALYGIDFSDNALTGLPSTSVWEKLTNLYYIYIGGNRGIKMDIPQVFFNLPYMYEVNGSYCSFTGDFPHLNNTEINSVYFSGNILDGTIKAPLMVGSLQYWTMDQNGLRGSLPASLGNSSDNLYWGNLRHFNVSFNRLTGTLPPMFNNMAQLRSLGLNNNGFYGALPDFQLLNDVQQFEGHTNFFNVCQSDPHISYTGMSMETCSAFDNLFPGACHCPEFFETVCQVDTVCPAPGFVPITVPLGEAPTPIRPPSLVPQSSVGGGPVGAATSSKNPSVVSALVVLAFLAITALEL